VNLYGLIGFPLGHSFSATYFARKFSREGIEAQYRNFPLDEITRLTELLQDEKGLAGLNVTVPYKERIIPYLNELDPVAREVGAVNTVVVDRDGGLLSLKGYNTDVIGFERSLLEHLGSHHKQALVLGTGGSAKAVEYVLRKLGIGMIRISRNRGEDRISYDDLGLDTVAGHTLVVNTTPVGMYPGVGECPPIPYDALTPGHLLFDLVYNPEKTLFLTRGQEQGAGIVNGYEMLVFQAEASWEIWNRESNLLTDDRFIL
jgi:shikimate dehydrogenase